MLESDGPTAYDISVCLHSAAIPAEPFAIGDSDPLTVRALRRFEDGALRSGLVAFPAGASTDAPARVATTLQFMVRHGTMTLGERVLLPDAFVVVPAGGTLAALSALEPSEILLILDEGQAYTAVADGDDAIVSDDVFAIEPIIPVIGGRVLHGFERRVLWLDPDSGADTRLLRVPGGFAGAGGPNWHPVNEEIFCLAGDIAPDETRPMQAGSFLWNPARAVHGFGEQSRDGCTLLEWHDGAWALTPFTGTAAEFVA